MKQSKKNKPRPKFICLKCKLSWVSCEPICMLCKTFGEPLNEEAEKLLRKAGEING